jgi:hypothetical protein
MKMHFDWRDCFKAPRLAISTGKRLILQSFGLIVGYLGYLILTYLAFFVSGQSITVAGKAYGFFPVLGLEFNYWISTLLWIIGILFLISLWMLSSTAVAKIAFEELKGDQFYSIKEAVRFARGRLSAVLSSPLTLLVLLLFVVMAGAAVGLLGRIPVVGELGFGVLYGIPIFVIAIFAVFVALVFTVSFLLTPAIVGARKSDTFTTVVEYFQTVWNQPGRFFGYTAITLVLAKIGVFVFGYFVMRSLQLINWACGLTMGSKLESIFQAALTYLPPSGVVEFFTTLYPGSSIAYRLTAYPSAVGLGVTESIAAFLIGVTLIVIFFLMLGYGLATLTCGLTVTYVVSYKHREDENLLEQKSEEEEATVGEVEGKGAEKLKPETKARA